MRGRCSREKHDDHGADFCTATKHAAAACDRHRQSANTPADRVGYIGGRMHPAWTYSGRTAESAKARKSDFG
jgi:hypothetical protein